MAPRAAKTGSDLTEEEYYSYVGKSAAENARLFAAKVGTDCGEELLKDKRAYYQELQVAGIPPIQAMIDFVHRLANEKKRLGIYLGVASAAKRKELLHNIKKLGLEECFDVVLSGQDDLTDYHDPEGVNKPKPYIYLHAAKLLKVLPEQCVVIEDSHPGISAASSAGCIAIAVPNAYTKEHDFSRSKLRMDSLADMDIAQFLHILERLRQG